MQELFSAGQRPPPFRRRFAVFLVLCVASNLIAGSAPTGARVDPTSQETVRPHISPFESEALASRAVQQIQSYSKRLHSLINRWWSRSTPARSIADPTEDRLARVDAVP